MNVYFRVKVSNIDRNGQEIPTAVGDTAIKNTIRWQSLRKRLNSSDVADFSINIEYFNQSVDTNSQVPHTFIRFIRNCQ